MMMKPTESCVPPGFRFHPTDEELVGYYLRKKVAAQKIDLDVIKDIDLYRIEPWDLPEKCRIGYEEEKEWYFFSHKDKKYPTGTRTNRATIAGFWKATGRDKAVYDHKSKVIGMRKTLVFYRGRAPNGNKSDWIMHEYRLESQENGPLQEEGWVVCRAFKKRATGQAKTCRESWGASQYFFNESSSTNNSMMNNPNDCMQAVPWQQQQHQHQHQNFLTQNFLCKQEADNLTINNFINSDSFLHLPPLDDEISPSLLPQSERHNFSDGGKNRVTDWRSLDKFVASQLSHVDHDDDDDDDDSNSGTGSLLVRPEEYFWNSISDCDPGISVFHH